MKNIIPTVIVLTVLIQAGAFSQPTEQWSRRLTSTGIHNESGNDIAVDGSGNVYVAGTYYNTTSPANFCFYVAKYNSAGILQWEKKYNGSATDDDGARKILIDGSGNIYALGYIINANKDIFILKLNSTGTELWSRAYTYNSSSEDGVESACLDAAGNLYLCGYKITSTAMDYLVIKYNSAGTVQWAQVYNGTGNDEDIAKDIAVSDSGNVYVTGRSMNSTNFDAVTIKYNSSGVQQWNKRYHDYSDQPVALALDPPGNVYVTGTCINSGVQGILIIKYNLAGIEQWVKKVSPSLPFPDNGINIAVSPASDVYVLGSSSSISNGYNISLIKYNTGGTQQWIKYFNGPGNLDDYGRQIVLDAGGNVYLLGYQRGIGTSDDYILLKFNSAGTQLWAQAFNGPDNGTDKGTAIYLDASGNIYLTGNSHSNNFGDDICTIKYSQSTGIQSIGNEIPAEFSLEQNYPNPFNPVTNIKFQMPRAGYVKFSVFDVSGKELSVIKNEYLAAGSYNEVFDGSNISSGTYFYRLSVVTASDSYSEVKKMVIVK